MADAKQCLEVLTNAYKELCCRISSGEQCDGIYVAAKFQETEDIVCFNTGMSVRNKQEIATEINNEAILQMIGANMNIVEEYQEEFESEDT